MNFSFEKHFILHRLHNPLLSVLKRLEALTGLRAHEMFDYCIGKDNRESGKAGFIILICQYEKKLQLENNL